MVDRSSSWNDGRLFLTFDIDWAHDDIIRDCVALVEEAGVKATFFITHESPIIDELRGNDLFELGIHPNFNGILNGTDTENNAEKIMRHIKAVIPEATAVRSHSTTYSSQLCNVFAQNGLTHDCNFFVPDYSEIYLKPWRNMLGITMVPYFWEDDVAFADESVGPISDLWGRKGLKVFDFHPIHVFLNSPSPKIYNETRHLHQNPEALRSLRYEGFGVRDQLLQILRLNKQI